MNVLGCDFSSRFVDFVKLELDSDRAEWHRFELQGADAFDRARSVCHVVPGPAHSFWDDVLAVGIEQPRGRYALVDLARIQGAVLSCLPSRMLVQPWNPASWRTAIGLSGRATKGEVQAFASLRLVGTGWTQWRQPATQDFYDAYCIALATRSAVQKADAA